MPLGVTVILDIITYHVTHKYFTSCIIFHIIGTYLWKLQKDTNSIPRYGMAFFTYRSWLVNCDHLEIWTIWACLQVTYERFILLSKCEQLNLVHWAKVLFALQKSYKKRLSPKLRVVCKGLSFMNSLGKFILNKTTSFTGSPAFPIFLMTAKILFVLIKTIGNVRDPGDGFVNRKFWETAESLFL